jgi:hypothetical protein
MLYYAVGTALVTEDELRPKLDEIADSKKRKGFAPITFRTGELSPASAMPSFEPAPGEVTPFQEIGLGKPLTVRIAEVYTGSYNTGFFGGSKDLLFTSAVKSIAAFEAKPRAVNILQKKVALKSRIRRPAATEEGTPFVFHTPALLERSLTMDLTMVFDTFPAPVFDRVGTAFQAAAGIPIFLAQSTYLLAAGALTKMVGAAGEALFDGKPAFDQSVALDIELPGTAPLDAGFALVTDTDLDVKEPRFRQDHMINRQGQVVRESDQGQYAGPLPYVVVCCDGTPMPELKSFAPTAASAALLERFFGAKSGKEVAMESLIESVRLYNDLRFRKQVDQIDKKLAETTDPDAKADLMKRREALKANILEELLKP